MLIDRSIGVGLDSLEWNWGRVLAARSDRITFSRRTTRAVRARKRRPTPASCRKPPRKTPSICIDGTFGKHPLSAVGKQATARHSP